MNNDLGRVRRVNASLSDGYDTDRTNGSGCDPAKPRKGDGRFERKRSAVARFAAALALTTCMSLPLTAAWAEEEPRTDGIPDPSIATSSDAQGL